MEPLKYIITIFFADGPRTKASFSAYKSYGRMYPAKKQTMQLQARAACASAVHVISAAGVKVVGGSEEVVGRLKG